MFPLLRNERDKVYVTKAEDYREGDIAFFRGPFGQPIMHRIVHISGDNYTFQGDANYNPEPQVHYRDLIGKVIAVTHKEKMYSSGSLVWRLYREKAALWHMAGRIKNRLISPARWIKKYSVTRREI